MRENPNAIASIVRHNKWKDLKHFAKMIVVGIISPYGCSRNKWLPVSDSELAD